jgi:hypothetical protein
MSLEIVIGVIMLVVALVLVPILLFLLFTKKLAASRRGRGLLPSDAGHIFSNPFSEPPVRRDSQNVRYRRRHRKSKEALPRKPWMR